jgi:ribosomal protein L36
VAVIERNCVHCGRLLRDGRIFVVCRDEKERLYVKVLKEVAQIPREAKAIDTMSCMKLWLWKWVDRAADKRMIRASQLVRRHG